MIVAGAAVIVICEPMQDVGESLAPDDAVLVAAGADHHLGRSPLGLIATGANRRWGRSPLGLRAAAGGLDAAAGGLGAAAGGLGATAGGLDGVGRRRGRSK